jgi:hypothetical protein
MSSPDCGSFGVSTLRFPRVPQGLSSIQIHASVERPDTGCFRGPEGLSAVTFELGSRLASIEQNAFCRCSSLQSIPIPASVGTATSKSFASCVLLSICTFESGSKRSTLAESTFSAVACCHPSSSRAARILRASTGKPLRNRIEQSAQNLSTVVFEPGCRLCRIEQSAFQGCSSLSSICILSSVEILHHSCFYAVGS